MYKKQKLIKNLIFNVQVLNVTIGWLVKPNESSLVNNIQFTYTLIEKR